MPDSTTSVILLAPACFSAPLAPPSGDSVIEPDALGSPSHATTDSLNDTPQNATCVIESVTQTVEQALMGAIGLPIPDIGHVPSAFCRYEQEVSPNEELNNKQGHSRQEAQIENWHLPEHIVCADPVHLLADKDNARLLPCAALDLQDAEADALIKSLNDLIQPDGLSVHKGLQGQWFLTGMDASALDSWPSHSVANGKIANFLPRLDTAGDWRRLMTEVQMLFHSHPVNEQRAARRQLPVNAIWFWGGAKLPEATAMSSATVYADDSFSQGLAAHYQLAQHPLADFQVADLATVADTDATTVIVDLSVYAAWLAGDADAVQRAKDNLIQHRVEPLQRALANGGIDKFILDGCEGQAIEEKQQARRVFSLSSWIKQALRFKSS